MKPIQNIAFQENLGAWKVLLACDEVGANPSLRWSDNDQRLIISGAEAEYFCSDIPEGLALGSAVSLQVLDVQLTADAEAM